MFKCIWSFHLEKYLQYIQWIGAIVTSYPFIWYHQFFLKLWPYGLPGSALHGILQVRIPEWVVVPSSRGSSWTRDWPAFPTLQAESLPSWVLQLTLFCSFDGWVIFHCIYVPHSVYSCVNGHLVCFHALAIVNSVAIEHWDASIFSNYRFFWVFA